MLRPSANCRVMRVEPTVLCEVISVTSVITPRWRSSGVATVVAIVSGLAPGICANTEIVGKSICGSGATGNLKNAKRPARARPIVSSVVATGRSINGLDRLTSGSSNRALGIEGGPETLPHRPPEPIEIEIDDRRREQGQQLTEDQTADNRHTQGMAQFRTRAGAEHQRQGAEDRRNDQEQLVAEGGLKGKRRALKGREHAGRKPNLALGVADRVDRLAKRGAGRQVERYRRRGKLAEMSDGKRRGLLD